MSLEAGQVLDGKYRIKRLIGAGGMGAVYEGENLRIQRRVAIKVVHGAYASDSGVLARFQREAQAAGRIGNDHILEVLDLGSLPDGSQYMVLEFLDGEPLSKRLERFGRIPPRELAPLMLQVLHGLNAAHLAGIFHRDLKPDNIFILKEKAGRRDFVKIIDFGISKFQPLSGATDGMKMTSTGAVMGTPYYMSPEQASGSNAVDARSDLYSIGVILYECVCGVVPFTGDSFNQLMFKIVLSDLEPPQKIVPDLDPAFASIIVKAMARDVLQRFQTADEFSRALTAWTETGSRVDSVRPDPATAAAAGAARKALASVAGAGGTNPGAAFGATPAAEVAKASHPGRATGGTWATSQVRVPERRNKVLVAATAGGLLVALASVGTVLALRGHDAPSGVASGAAGDTSATGVAPVVNVHVTPPPAPSPSAAPVQPPSEVAALPVPVPSASAAPVVSVVPAAKPGTGDKGQKVAAPPPSRPPKGKGKGSGNGDEPYFGY